MIGLWEFMVLDADESPRALGDLVLTEFALSYGPDWARYFALGLLVTGAWLYVRAEAEQAAVLGQVALASARLDQQTAEARLQMLEAQIEPHFLFNTLANVKRLYDIDRGTGARMLRNLKDYLAVALPQMRETESTLGREVAHVTAYLNIQQIRMGRRLAFGIDVPASLHGARMPPLMLLTLAENAIKHGLAPSPRGGRIDLRAATADGRLRVEVADTGQGFA
jgi:sensor histidine kinase YesM